MKKIQFSKEERDAIVRRIQEYFVDELETDIGSIPAELLLEFFTEEVGSFYYNRGLYDAQTVLSAKIEDLTDAIYGLEQPTEMKR